MVQALPGTRSGPFFWQRSCREANLLVFKQKEGAVKLYERNDFKDINRAAVGPHGMNPHQWRSAGSGVVY
jgi:hypothetical protein